MTVRWHPRSAEWFAVNYAWHLLGRHVHRGWLTIEGYTYE